MEAILGEVVTYIQNFVQYNNIFLSIFVGMFVISLESIIPALPLSVFIAINTIAFGSIVGFIISWIATIIGCSISFFLCRKLRKIAKEKIKKEGKIIAFIDKIDCISFSNLFLILAMPFTPAFSINIAAGLSKMRYKKYFFALLFSKAFIVFFWGYVGSNIMTNITNIGLMIEMILLIVLLFIMSKIVTKKFNL
ncbi:MAG: TVP38/TMEM64 family protein [Bacilli bacterium]|nr:TVP38/TMEM64 family protein [Bacilli bacterium]